MTPILPSSIPVLDNFDRANGALGANWALISGDGTPPTISGNKAIGPTSGSARVYWTPAQLGPACAVKLTLAAVSGTAAFLVLRAKDVGTTGCDYYLCQFSNGGPITVIRVDNKGLTTLKTANAGRSLVIGDVLAFMAVGPTLSAWLNGAMLTSVDDATYAAAGYAGFGLSTNTSEAADDWGALTIAAPVNTVAPALSGTPATAETLSCSAGTWTGTATITETYQWQRDAGGSGAYSNIPGATASTHLLVSADAHCHVRCAVTATGPGGAVTAYSNALLIARTPPALIAEIAFTDDPIAGYFDAVLHDGPVAYWRMSETGGLTDQTAHGNNGTFPAGAPTLVAGLLTNDDDQASSFNGTTYGSVPDSPSLSPTDELTIECWEKLASLPGSTRSIKEKAGSYKVEIDSTGHVLFTITNGSSSATVTSATALTTGVRHHIVCTYDGTYLIVYLAGIQDAAILASIGIADTANALLIASGATGTIACVADEVAIFGKALSPGQVAAHFAADAVVEWDDLTWTAIDVAALATKRGRQYELDRTETGTAALTIKDLSRLYDPSNTDSPLAGYILPLRECRARIVVCGVSYGLFRGALDGWPQNWLAPGVAEHDLTAADGFEALAITEVTAEIPAAASGVSAAAVLDAALWPRAARQLDAGGYACQAISLDGTKALDPFQTITDGEGGIAFCDGDGEIEFHDKDHRFSAARSTSVQATWVDGASGAGDNVYQSIATSYDKERIVNSWAVSAGDGTTETAEDDNSIRLNRKRPNSKSTYLDAAGAAGVAATLVSRTAWPLYRIEAVTFVLTEENSDEEWISLLEREISDRVQVKMTPGEGSPVDQESWIEGIAWSTDDQGKSYRVTFSLSPVFAASYFTTVIATPGVVAYYRMSSPDPLRDRSAFGNDGAMLGAVTPVAGMTTDGDEAESFDGTTQSGLAPDSESLSITGPMGISGFVNVPSLPAATRNIVAKPGSYLLQMDSAGHLIFIAKNNATSGSVTSVATLSPNTAYHVACVYDGGHIRIYIDGSEDNSAVYSGGIADSKMPLVVARRFAVTAAPAFQSFAWSNPNSDGNRTTLFRCDKPTGTAKGDLLIAQITPDSPNNGWINSVPDGWTLVPDAFDNHTKTYIYWKVAGSAEPAYYDWTVDNASYGNMAIARVSGVDPLLTFTGDIALIYVGSGTSCDPGAVLPSIEKSLILAFFTAQSGDTTHASWTETAGGTEAYDFHLGDGVSHCTSIAMNYRQQSSPSSIDVVGTASRTSQMFGVVMVLPGNGSALLACTVDELAIFNVAPSADDVAAQYAAR